MPLAGEGICTACLACHLLQAADTLFNGRMRAEEIAHAAAEKRCNNKEV